MGLSSMVIPIAATILYNVATVGIVVLVGYNLSFHGAKIFKVILVYNFFVEYFCL